MKSLFKIGVLTFLVGFSSLSFAEKGTSCSLNNGTIMDLCLANLDISKVKEQHINQLKDLSNYKN